jgi:hypothetical protein
MLLVWFYMHVHGESKDTHFFLYTLPCFYLVCSREIKHQSLKRHFFSLMLCSRCEENSNIKIWEQACKKKGQLWTLVCPSHYLCSCSFFVVVHGRTLFVFATPDGHALLLFMVELELFFFPFVVCKFVAMAIMGFIIA